MSRIVRLEETARGAVRAALGARRGGVAIIFALMVPVLAICVFGGVDISQELNARSRLQDATDAAALAVSATDAETPTSKKSDLQTVAGNLLAANFPAYSGSGGTPSITSFKVCTVNQQDDCAGGQVTNTVTISTQVQAPCWAPLVMPGLCTSDGQSMLLTATNTTNVGLPSAVQMSFVLDVSGSMIVGSMPTDIQKVINWNNTPANWNSLTDSEGSPQCAFACHDEGNGNGQTHPTTSGAANSDMDWGITNAHAAGATTRYDVMLDAAIAGVGQVQTLATQNSQLAKNSYYFNIYPFSDDLGKAAFSATASQPNDYSDAEAAITRANLPVGLDTHFSTTFTTLLKSIGGASGSGASYTSPLKVVILITDGLQSDFYSDFQYFLSSYDKYMDTTPWASQASKTAWSTSGTTTGPNAQGWTGHNYPNEYAGPIPASVCQSMAANHIILGIVETPYVPLDKATINGQVTQLTQSPSISNYEFYPYESFIRPVIYPKGPNTSSTVSTALQSCVTNPNYYAVANTADPNGIKVALQKVVQAVVTTNAYLQR